MRHRKLLIFIIYSAWFIEAELWVIEVLFSCSPKNVIMKLTVPGWTSTFGSWPSPLNASSRASRCSLTENSEGSSGRLSSSSSSSGARGCWGPCPSPWLIQASCHSQWMRRLIKHSKLLTRWPVVPAKWCFSGAQVLKEACPGASRHVPITLLRTLSQWCRFATKLNIRGAMEVFRMSTVKHVRYLLLLLPVSWLWWYCKLLWEA